MSSQPKKTLEAEIASVKNVLTRTLDVLADNVQQTRELVKTLNTVIEENAHLRIQINVLEAELKVTRDNVATLADRILERK